MMKPKEYSFGIFLDNVFFKMWLDDSEENICRIFLNQGFESRMMSAELAG